MTMPHTRQDTFLSATAILLTIFAASSATSAKDDIKTTFWDSLSALCGKAFEGKVVSTDPQDAELAKARLVMHVRECSDKQIKIPFHVGENRSRTWVLSDLDGILELKHDHRHDDGHEDTVTQYGGRALDAGTKSRQAFPADHFSIEMFKREGLDVSINNVWAVEVDDATFTYELSRPNRLFRVAFDLSKPIAPPPAPWGHE